MKVDPPKKNKSQIKLFGQKKKTNAEKVLEELLNANTPAVMIKLPNDQVGVFNLNTNKYEFLFLKLFDKSIIFELLSNIF